MEGNATPNCFYSFPPDEFLLMQGCTPELLKKFKATRPLFDPFHVKKLDDNIAEYKAEVIINNVSFLLKATHELKINDVHRLLVFAIPSDDKNAQVYIPMQFVDSGLHKQNIIEAEASSIKSFVLNLPSSTVTAGMKLQKL